MHVVYCIPSLHYASGMERIVIAKANYLVRQFGYQVSFVTTCLRGRRPAFCLDDAIRIYDLDIDYTIDEGNPLRKYWKKYQLRCEHRRRLDDLLKKLSPDVTVSTFLEDSSFLPLIKDGSRKVQELHFSRNLKSKYRAIRLNHFPFSVFLSVTWTHFANRFIFMPRFDKFVTLTAEDLANWGGVSGKRCFIHNMIPWQPEKSMLDSKVAIAVGRLDKMKGFERMIDIWQKVAEQYPDWKLRIIGEGQERESLQSKIDSLGLSGNILLVGQSADMRQEYLHSSVLLMTSFSEGLPMCLLEAKACGVPVVSYDFLCGPKDVINYGVDGFLIREGDAESFCRSVMTLIEDSDLRHRMGEAQLLDSKRFSPDKIMSEWKSLFDNLVSKSK